MKGRVFRVARRLYNKVLQDGPANLHRNYFLEYPSIRLHSIVFPSFAIFLCSQHVSVVEREREGTKKAAAPKDKSLPLARLTIVVAAAASTHL